MKSSPNSQRQPLQIEPRLSRCRNDRGDGPVASTPRRRGWSRWAFGRVVLNARRVPELVQEVVVIVAADQVVRNRHADGRRHRKGGIGPWREPFESMSHQRYHPRQSLDDVGRFDVDHSQSGVGLLVRDDHAQRRVEPFAFRKVGGRLGNGALVVLPLPHHEGVEQLPLRGDPSVERRTRNRGPQCATSERLSFVMPLRPSTSAVAASIRSRDDRSATANASSTVIALQIFVEVSR